jgi:MtaA/CmuA family methyltransferase
VNGRERVIAMMEHRPVDRPPLMPITMMFAARQTGVKYRAYVTDHRVMAEAQLRTAEKFGFDFVSTISDPAREAADLGAAIEWFDDQPPSPLESRGLLHDKATLAALRAPDPLGGGRMTDRVQGVALMAARAAGQVAVEGWIEGPCAQAADLRGINTLMLDFYDDPAFVRDLFAFVIDMELSFARAQLAAGADLIGVGDAAASLIGPALYDEFVWPFEQKLVDGLHGMGARVRLHICGRTRRIFPGMGKLGCEIVDLDFLAPVAEARKIMGPGQVLLGNVEPVGVLQNGTPEIVRATVAACHRDAGARFIVGAGCEVTPGTPEENLRALCEYARQAGASGL